MIYEYNDEVVNRSNDFFDIRNFVGYILPDGSIFKCQNHNISNIDTFLKMYLDLLDSNYEKKDELLNIETDNKLAKVVISYLKKMSYEEIHSFIDFTTNNTLSISDLLVSFFGCHLVTRLKKEILTSEPNHVCFYNYLLHDFKIETIGKLVYDSNSKTYKYITPIVRNDYLYDEIERLKNEIGENDISLFHK